MTSVDWDFIWIWKGINSFN